MCLCVFAMRRSFFQVLSFETFDFLGVFSFALLLFLFFLNNI